MFPYAAEGFTIKIGLRHTSASVSKANQSEGDNMKYSVDGQALSEKHQFESEAILKYSVLILGLGTLSLILLSSLYYLFSGGTAVLVPANLGAITGAEQMLSADYVLQTDFVMGRYLLPFFISLLFTGALLFWVLRTHEKTHS